MVQLIPLANQTVADEIDKIRFNQLAVVQQLIVEKMMPKVYVETVLYRVRILVEEEVWQRPYTSKSFCRDLHLNERESYRYIKDNLEYFGVSNEDLENYLSNLVETGPFYYPLALFNRMAALLPGFGDAGSQVLSAVGRKDFSFGNSIAHCSAGRNRSFPRLPLAHYGQTGICNRYFPDWRNSIETS